MLSFPLSAFLALSDEQAAYTLAQMLCHVSGAEYAPRYAKRLRVVEGLRGGMARQSLHHCEIYYQKGRVSVAPQPSAPAPYTKPLVPAGFISISSL